MGNKGSQPVVESARTVLSRRKMPEAAAEAARAAVDAAATAAAAATTATPNAATSTPSTTPSTAPSSAAPAMVRPARPVEQNYADSTILKEMSKWDVVKSTKVQSPKYTKDNAGAAAVASMIRHEEEQLPVNQRGSITGRLGETHVLELFVHLRDGTRTHEELAEEFKLTVADVQKLDSVARMPIVEKESHDSETYVAK